MPTFRPFRALRYADPARASAVTAPPYDVISHAERSRLLRLDPQNVIRITLGGDHPSGPVSDDRYQIAADVLREWIESGVLIHEDDEACYVISMEHPGGSTMGVLGSLTLEELGSDGIFPHERTLPAPKADRLELLRSTEANLEPLWFFASKPMPSLRDVFEGLRRSPALMEVTDPKGVTHRLWRVPPRESAVLASSVERTPLVIADGHHRYETALTYMRERHSRDGAGPWDATLAFVSDTEVHPPLLLPIHRVVDATDLGDLPPDAEPFDGTLMGLAATVASKGPGNIGMASPKGLWIVHNDAPGLDTVFVGDVIKDRPVRYEHDLSSVSAAVEDGATACLLAPVTMQTVADRALSGERMPPKTTLFHPKPLSGLVMRDLAAS